MNPDSCLAMQEALAWLTPLDDHMPNGNDIAKARSVLRAALESATASPTSPSPQEHSRG